MLIGLVLGWILDESFSDALLGALLGLGIGQAIRIGRLGSQAAEQRQLLEQAQVALNAVQQRLALLEVSGVKAPETSEPVASEPCPPEFTLDEIPVEAPELIWELPPELEPITAAAAETSRPLPVDAWKPEPVARDPPAATTCHPARPELHRPRHQRRPHLAVRRQHRAAGRCGAVVSRSGLPAALRHRRHGGADRVALRRCCGGGVGPARSGLVAAYIATAITR